MMSKTEFIEFAEKIADAAGQSPDYDHNLLREVLAFGPTQDEFYHLLGSGGETDADKRSRALERFGRALDAMELDFHRRHRHTLEIFRQA